MVRLLSLLVRRLHALNAAHLRLKQVLDLRLVVVQRGAQLLLVALELLENGVHAALRLLGLEGFGEERHDLVAVGDQHVVPFLDRCRLALELGLVALEVGGPACYYLFHRLVLEAGLRRGLHGGRIEIVLGGAGGLDGCTGGLSDSWGGSRGGRGGSKEAARGGGGGGRGAGSSRRGRGARGLAEEAAGGARDGRCVGGF